MMRWFFLLVFGLPPVWVFAAVEDQRQLVPQDGRWIPATSGAAAASEQAESGLVPAPTGGDYRYALDLELSQAETLVIDFKSSSTIAHFSHRVVNSQGAQLAELNGGISSLEPGDYFLRHGKKLHLPAGRYRIETTLDSPFYLAIPTPVVYREAHYLTQVRYSQALTLIGTGIFFALAFYYLVIGLWRGALTDLLYAGFIVGNLLYNSTAQLIFKDLFGWHGFYWVSSPILVSNMLYVGFVMVLLGINPHKTPRLFKTGLAAIALLASFWPLALIAPNWSLEFARYGVAIFALYGLAAGISQSLARHRVAYFYLIANAAFVVPAFMAISLKNLAVADFLLIEHIGMIAVLIEVLLLAQVMSYQIGLVYKERAQHQAAAEQGRLLSNLTAQVPGVIYQFRLSPDGVFSMPFASQGLQEMFALEPAELANDASPALERVYPEDLPAFMAAIRESARTMEPWTHEFRVSLPGQDLTWRAGNSQPERQSDGSVLWHGFITDITERKLIDEKMRHMAQHDPLTNLPNRALFMDRFDHALAQAKRQQTQLALMFIDLDDFKLVNDQYGHQAGDMLLQKIARQLALSLRASDTAARIGGDEFVVLLQPVSGPQNALTVATKVQVALKASQLIDSRDLQVSASIGIALYPEHGDSSGLLIRAADAAMYQAKKRGRDNIHLYLSDT